jgi:hypothetical protein
MSQNKESLMIKMTNDQEKHLARIQAAFIRKSDEKYRAGQKEHGGELIAKNDLWILDAALSEAIDQVIYLETLRERIVGKEGYEE